MKDGRTTQHVVTNTIRFGRSQIPLDWDKENAVHSLDESLGRRTQEKRFVGDVERLKDRGYIYCEDYDCTA